MPGGPAPVAGRIVVAMVARAPSANDESRLGTDLTAEQQSALRYALFGDSLDVLRRIRNVAPVVVYEPAEARAEIRARVPLQMAVVGQPERPASERLSTACNGFLAMGARGVVVIGSAAPDLPPSRIREAVECLTEERRRVVIGPNGTGGCYLIGVGAAECDVLANLRWGTEGVELLARQRAAAAGLSVFALEPWAETHALADVTRVIARRSRAARRTRAWAHALLRHAGPGQPSENPSDTPNLEPPTLLRHRNARPTA